MSITVETHPTLAGAAGAMRDGTQFLGGGTMVVRGVNFGAQTYDRIVRCTDANLRDIRAEGDAVAIGAGVTMAQIIARPETDFLAQVARSVGGPALRNMASVGGNLFVRAPFGDFGVALLALGATLRLADGQTLPIDKFYAARAQFRGLIASVLVPRPAAGAFRYSKISRTKPKGAAVMTIAAYLPGAGRITGAAIAFGAMGAVPLRARSAEAALEGAALDQPGIERAVLACLEGLDPQDDSLASAWYRRAVAPVHLRRLLLDGGR